MYQPENLELTPTPGDKDNYTLTGTIEHKKDEKVELKSNTVSPPTRDVVHEVSEQAGAPAGDFNIDLSFFRVPGENEVKVKVEKKGDVVAEGSVIYV